MMEEPVRIDQCHNIGDFRKLAMRRLPGPIFNYIDGAADDEVTYRRNTASFEECDLVPNVLRGVEVMMLTVDSITGGNRERDLRTGFSIPFKLTLGGMAQFAIKPMWGLNYLTHEKFKLPQLDQHVDMSGGAMSIGRYFTEMLDPSMNWDDVADMVQQWNGQFCLKGIMSVAD